MKLLRTSEYKSSRGFMLFFLLGKDVGEKLLGQRHRLVASAPALAGVGTESATEVCALGRK